MDRTRLAALIVSAVAALAACSRPAPPPAAAAPPASVPAPAVSVAPPAAAPVAVVPTKPGPLVLPACELVTGEQMSAILGEAVIADTVPPRGGATGCLYMPEKRKPGTYASLVVTPGGGEAGMKAMGKAGAVDPELAKVWEGIGDQAFMNGEALNVRTGDDLVQITLAGVSNVPAKARAILVAIQSKR